MAPLTTKFGVIEIESGQKLKKILALDNTYNAQTITIIDEPSTDLIYLAIYISDVR